MSKTKLAPCPWCGKEPDLETIRNNDVKYYYSCNNIKCPVTPCTAAYKDKKSATRAGNKCKPKTFYTVPSKCKKCRFCSSYTQGRWARSPHYYCEFMYHLYEVDYKVDPDTVDKNCLLKKLVIVD